MQKWMQCKDQSAQGSPSGSEVTKLGHSCLRGSMSNMVKTWPNSSIRFDVSCWCDTTTNWHDTKGHYLHHMAPCMLCNRQCALKKGALCLGSKGTGRILRPRGSYVSLTRIGHQCGIDTHDASQSQSYVILRWDMGIADWDCQMLRANE